MNQIRTYDITIKADGCADAERLQQYFDRECSKWVFQKERGEETGYEHYQCRISFKKKMRQQQAIEKLQTELEIRAFKLTPTSKNCIRNNEEYYCTKEETRIAGPWQNVDGDIDPYWRTATLRPWQQEIVTEMENYVPEMRKINLIVDTRGTEGKSFLTNYLRIHNRIYIVPPLSDYKDVMQFLMSIYTDNKPIFIDIPRGLAKRSYGEFFSAMETIKGGYLYETRYRGRDRVIRPPAMYIFTNHYPDKNLLSLDRWNVKELKDGKLTKTFLYNK